MTEPLAADRGVREAGELPSYALVSPVRDEALNVERTLASIVDQSHRPVEWVVVDDGSTDGTRAIAERYSAEHPWIRVVDSARGGRRDRGAAVAQSFARGRGALSARPDFTVVLDGDLFVPPHYFEWVAATFAFLPRAGIVGGVVLSWDGERWVPERAGRHVTFGCIKAYRTDCLEEIGGLHPSMGWDGIDEYAARARGWSVQVLTELTVLHYKRRGSGHAWWRSRWDEGVGNAFMGYRPAFLAVRAGYRGLVERPPIAGGLVLAAGYAWARLTRRPQVPDELARRELRAEQRRRLASMLSGRGGAAPVEPPPGGGPAFWSTGARRPPELGPGAAPDGSPREPA